MSTLRFSRRRIVYTACLAVIFLLFWFCLPDPLFSDDYSVLLKDKDRNLLSASIAKDGQWRFPQSESLNPKFRICVIVFEDQYFYGHPGVNPGAIARAFMQNRRAGKIVSGGSTITMQLVRLIRKNKPRTYAEKLLEIVMAFRLELSYSKESILKLYASHAPFGSNVVGVDAAAWRYFGRSSSQLSWAECATLAVLPNAPSLIYPGKNQEKLRDKRNRLLAKLRMNNRISEEDYELALQEPLPQKPYALPNKARHLLNRCVAEQNRGGAFLTTIDGNLQDRVLDILKRHAAVLKHNEIHNLAALVLDVRTNEVLAYAGNTPLRDKEPHGEDVDVIASPRSTGSILKPFLYGFMLNDGELLPNTLVPDVPTQIAGYTPQNYDLNYDGAVPAKRALARSLNIPAVKMLQKYGINRFTDRLKQVGLTTINRSADNYGLSLILGGAEGKLWDLCSAYASMARVLRRYNASGTYSRDDWNKPTCLIQTTHGDKTGSLRDEALMRASAVWLAFEAMVEVARPDLDASWQRLGSAQKVAWKTGTSFGFRDGWAIGVTPDYVVGVWVGNADGEGRPGLTGISTAAPVLFEIIGQLPASFAWFRMPVRDLQQVTVCAQSGCRASEICPNTRKEWVPLHSDKTTACPYHKWIHLDASRRFRVTDACVSPGDMVNEAWFVLPPVQEYYYKTRNPTYQTLPPYKPGCQEVSGRSMEMIYPKPGTVIYIPLELNGEQGKAIFEVAHRVPGHAVFWHIDGVLAGTTKEIHQLAVNTTRGHHMLVLSDDTGETITVPFEVASEKK